MRRTNSAYLLAVYLSKITIIFIEYASRHSSALKIYTFSFSLFCHFITNVFYQEKYLIISMILQKWHNDCFCFYEFVINSRKHITQNNEMKRIVLRVTHANLPSVCILKSLFQSILISKVKTCLML